MGAVPGITQNTVRDSTNRLVVETVAAGTILMVVAAIVGLAARAVGANAVRLHRTRRGPAQRGAAFVEYPGERRRSGARGQRGLGGRAQFPLEQFEQFLLLGSREC